jgi:dihydroorotase
MPELRTADCMICGPNVKVYSRGKAGFICAISDKNRQSAWRKTDNGKLYSRRNTAKHKLNHVVPHRKHLKDSCEKCGFVAIDKCQLDVHHVDFNHKNNNPENLQTLCANCHRLLHEVARKNNLITLKKSEIVHTS